MTTLSHDTSYSNDPREALETWYATSGVGQRLREQLVDDLAVALDELFGYHMVLLGTDPAIDIPSMTRVQQVIRSRPGAGSVGSGALSVCALDEELPFETESVDVVVALHALDVSEDPHQALREIRRVLTPHGHLILVGMNPRSLLGGLRRLQSARSQSSWRGISPVSPHKAQDWLSLLDFNSDHARHKLVLPTSTRGGRLRGVLQRLDERLVRHNVPLGSAYVIHAQKMVRAHLIEVESRRVRARLISIPVSRPVAGARLPTQHRHRPGPRLRPVK